jgi:two-component system response regulator DctR
VSTIAKKLESLTPREREALDELLQGHNNREIAQSLGVTLRTVEENFRRIFRKMQVTSRSELIVEVYEALIHGKLEPKKGRQK